MKKGRPLKDDVWKRDELESPCVQICVVHPEARICAGCLRSIDEISRWSNMDSGERQRIMEELPNRRGHLKKRRGGRASRLGKTPI